MEKLDDIKNIGLSDKMEVFVKKIEETNIFKEQIHIAKFSMSIAINQNAEVDANLKASTKWRATNFEPYYVFRDLIELFYPDYNHIPNRAIQSLINTGFEILQPKIQKHDGEIDPIKLKRYIADNL